MDRTLLYHEIVRIALEGESKVPADEPAVAPDSVTRECTEIARSIGNVESGIKQVRKRYLAMSGPQQMSDDEKDTFDYTIRRMLQNEQQRIRRLEQLEAARQAADEQQRKKRWWAVNPKADGVSQTLAQHRKGMFFYLNSQLHAVSQALAEMQQVRLARNASPGARKHAIRQPTELPVEHGRIKEPTGEVPREVPGDVPGEVPRDVPRDAPPAPAPQEQEQQQQHQQLLLEEHDVLLDELNATLDKAQQAEQSLREIADLQTELNQHLAAQTLQLDSMSTDAMRTTKDISGANEQLARAKKNSRRASRIVIGSSLITGVLLLMLNGR